MWDSWVGSSSFEASNPVPPSLTSTTASRRGLTSTVTLTWERGRSRLPCTAALDSASATATARSSR